jgi:hypothetical protein
MESRKRSGKIDLGFDMMLVLKWSWEDRQGLGKKQEMGERGRVKEESLWQIFSTDKSCWISI